MAETVGRWLVDQAKFGFVCVPAPLILPERYGSLWQWALFARRLVAANERREGEGDSDIQYPSLSYVLCSSRLK